jgi:hypothetical protein
MTNRLRSVTLSFLESAPYRWDHRADVGAPQAAVFAAISADPSTWTWFPGITSGCYRSDGTPGVGSIREVRMGEVLYRETMLAWDEPSRWAYRVDESSVDFFQALAEDWVVEDLGDHACVRWTFAVEPSPELSLSLSDPPPLIADVFRQAMSNLDAHLGATSGRRA